MQLVALLRSMLLPHGFPESVAPQFAPYMSWRAAQVPCRPRLTHHFVAQRLVQHDAVPQCICWDPCACHDLTLTLPHVNF